MATQYLYQPTAWSLLTDPENTLIVVDEKVFQLHAQRFEGWHCYVVKSGEAHKTLATVEAIVEQAMALELDRSATLLACGGGMVCDITGFAASIYMRGVKSIYIPTTLLAMVDAAIGGKTAVNKGLVKNLMGTFYEPHTILYDLSFLATLLDKEWRNGRAEMVKHYCIAPNMAVNTTINLVALQDAPLFTQLEIIKESAAFKQSIIAADPHEKGQRKLLNFGHTIGHAIETLYGLDHGEAIAIGMVSAAYLSRLILGFDGVESLVLLLIKIGLPTSGVFDVEQIAQQIRWDKKRNKQVVDFILLENWGSAVVHPIPIDALQYWLNQLPNLSKFE